MQNHVRLYLPLLSVVTLILIFYTATRLYGITDFPLFNDEAIYVRWAQLGRYDPSQRLISLVDGKQPLFIWLTSIAMGVISHPLFAGRLVSMIAGVGTMIGLYFLTYELFNKKFVAMGAVLLYALIPFALVYNRLALLDALLGMFIVLSVYLQVLIARTLRLDYAFILGFTTGAAILTKTPGFLTLYLAPLALLLVPWKRRIAVRQLARWIGLMLVVLMISSLAYSVLRLSPHYAAIDEKNTEFIFDVARISPLQLLKNAFSNLILSIGWIAQYITPYLFFLIIPAIIGKQHRKERLFLFAWVILSIGIISFVGRKLYPRYYFPSTLILLPLISFGFWQLYERFKKKAVIIGALVIMLVVYNDYRILTDLPRAPIPQADLVQYANGWAAGNGMKEIVQHLQKEAMEGKVYIVSEGRFGSFPATVVELFFWHYPQVEYRGIDSITGKIPNSLVEKSRDMPVYVIVNKEQTVPSWPVELVMEHRKGVSDYFVRLYKVTDVPIDPCDIYYEEIEKEPKECQKESQ